MERHEQLWSVASKLSMLEIAFATLVGQLATTTQNPNREIEALLQQIKSNMDAVLEFGANRSGQEQWVDLMEANFKNLEQNLRFGFRYEKPASDLN